MALQRITQWIISLDRYQNLRINVCNNSLGKTTIKTSFLCVHINFIYTKHKYFSYAVTTRTSWHNNINGIMIMYINTTLLKTICNFTIKNPKISEKD